MALSQEFNASVCVCVCVCELSHVPLLVTPWTIAHQAPHGGSLRLVSMHPPSHMPVDREETELGGKTFCMLGIWSFVSEFKARIWAPE